MFDKFDYLIFIDISLFIYMIDLVGEMVLNILVYVIGFIDEGVLG